MGCKGASGSELTVATQTLKADIASISKWTHGAETETVALGGVTTPTIRGLVLSVNTAAQEQCESVQNRADGQYDQIQNRADGAVALATAQANIAVSAADASASSAVTSQEAAQQALNAAGAIPGFANNAYAIYAIRVDDDFMLTGYKSEPGETLYVDDFDGIAVLPASCQMKLEDGRLKLNIPFTA